MPKRITVDVELSDAHVDALETVKGLLMADPETGVRHDTPIERVYCEMANVGLALMSRDMKRDGTWDRCREEVRLGKEADEALR